MLGGEDDLGVAHSDDLFEELVIFRPLRLHINLMKTT
jgi:hypothetical protein